jgi:hypothetical protein
MVPNGSEFQCFHHGLTLATWCSIMKTAIATLVVLMLLASTRTGQCQEKAQAEGERTWYGGQIILADFLSCAATVGLMGSGAAALGFVGYGAYAIVPPVIHGRHNNRGGLALSLGLRVILPLVGFAISSGMADCSHSEDRSYCSNIGGLPGFGIGVLAATIIDSAFLAWESKSTTQPAPPPTSAPPKSQTSISLASIGVVPSSNGASLVVGGLF